jgi:DNA-binding response OmpR family regulator
LGEQSLFVSLDQQYYRDAHLFVHLRHQVVMLDGQAITLTRMEYRLLALLVQHAGEVVTRTIILTQIWGHAPETPTRTMDVHVRRLRKKLGIYGRQYIETVTGVGYSFRPLQ